MLELPLVSIILVSWNSRKDLQDCLPSLMAQEYSKVEVIIIDNASPDRTADWIAELYPKIRLVRNEKNIGFAAAVNQGFAIARGDVLVELNPDTIVEPDWLLPLVEAVAKPGVGLATSRVMLMKQPNRVNACGNEISLTGLTFCIGIGKEATDYLANNVNSNEATPPVPAISGAAFAMSRSCYEEIGCFDVDYFTYFEDTDLSLRARLAGFEIVLASKSVVYHDYEFRFSPQKMYWIERNRHLTLLKHLQWKTLLYLLPALLLGDAMAWAYALLRGPETLQAKAKAFAWVVGHLGEIRRRHNTTQTLRRVKDDVLIETMTTHVPLDQTIKGPLGKKLTQLIEPVLAWWQRKIIRQSSQPRIGTSLPITHRIPRQIAKGKRVFSL